MSLSRVRWVTDDGIVGNTVVVTIVPLRQSTVRWVTNDGISGGNVTVTVNESSPNIKFGNGVIDWWGEVTGSGQRGGTAQGSGGTLSVSSSLTSTGSKSGVGNGAIDWWAEVTSTGVPVRLPNGTGAVSTLATLDGVGTAAMSGTAVIDSVADLTGTTFLEHNGTIDSAGTLTSAGEPGHLGAGIIDVFADLLGSGAFTPPGLSVIVVVGELTSVGAKDTTGTGDIGESADEPECFGFKGGEGDGVLDYLDEAIIQAIGERSIWFFHTPEVSEPWPYLTPKDFFRRVFIERGITVLKINGAYIQVREPDGSQIDGADVVYLGGHIYEVSDEEVVDLTNAGYGSQLFSRLRSEDEGQ